jgi:hypothetical protein
VEELDFSRFLPPQDPINLIFLAAAIITDSTPGKAPILEAYSIKDMMDIVERLYRRENGLMPLFTLLMKFPFKGLPG